MIPSFIQHRLVQDTTAKGNAKRTRNIHHTELVVDVLAMRGHSTNADSEALRDLLFAKTLAEQEQDFHLPLG